MSKYPNKTNRYPNVLECLQCGMILVSFHRHDFKTCSCPNRTMVDGGYDYLRYGGVDMRKIRILKIVKAPILKAVKKRLKNARR